MRCLMQFGKPCCKGPALGRPNMDSMTTLNQKIAALPAERRERVLRGSEALIAAEAANRSGLRNLGDGDYQRAIVDFSKALELDPGNAAAYNNRGLAYVHQSDYARAIADFNAALDLDPELFECLVNRGLAHDEQSDYSLAVADFDNALRLRPGFAPAYYSRSLTYSHMGDYEKAAGDFDRATQLLPALARNGDRPAYLRIGEPERDGVYCDRRIHTQPEATR